MKPRIALTVAVAAVALAATACGSSEDTAGSTSAAPSSSSTTSSATETQMADSMGDLVGAGCADYAKAVPSGAGSVEGMSKDPVATAASNNPLLTTLVATVSGKYNPKVNLVDTLNNDEFTVFAPVDEAFAKVDAATLEKLKTDDKLLSSILTYHVVPGQLSPADVAGMQKTVQGGEVNVTGSGDALKVNDANVICGGVKTANATVYLIDSVLLPKA